MDEIVNLFESEGDQTESSNEIVDIMEQEDSVEKQVDEVEETTEAESTELETDEPTVTEVEVQKQEEQKFSVPYKYKDEVGEITDPTEAQRLVQLGMLHEKKYAPVIEQYKETSEKFEKISKLAELYNMNVDQLHDSLLNQYINEKAEREGLTPEQVRKDRELQERESIIKAEQAEKDRIAHEQAEKEKANEMYSRFMSLYPDVKGEDIAKEVWEMVDKGVDLTAAYVRHENETLKKQLATSTQNMKNKSSSPPVSTSAKGVKIEQGDEVDEAFMSYFK